MTARSTRNKLKFQGMKAIKAIEAALSHLQTMHEISEGQSPYIEQKLPLIVTGMEINKQILVKFREGL